MSQDPVEPPSSTPPPPAYDLRNYLTLPESSLIPRDIGTFTLVTGPPGSRAVKFTLDRSAVIRQSSAFALIFNGDTSRGQYIRANDGTEVVEIPRADPSVWAELVRAILSPLWVEYLEKAFWGELTSAVHWQVLFLDPPRRSWGHAETRQCLNRFRPPKPCRRCSTSLRRLFLPRHITGGERSVSSIPHRLIGTALSAPGQDLLRWVCPAAGAGANPQPSELRIPT